MPESETLFEIDGEQLEVPVWDSFTWDESQFVYDRTGYAVEDFVVADPDASEAEQLAHEAGIAAKVKNPALKLSLAVIAYVRAHPDVGYAETFDRLRTRPLLDVFADDVEDETEGEPSPPEDAASTSEPNASSPDSMPDSSGNFGTDSVITSVAPAEPPERIGATR